MPVTPRRSCPVDQAVALARAVGLAVAVAGAGAEAAVQLPTAQYPGRQRRAAVRVLVVWL